MPDEIIRKRIKVCVEDSRVHYPPASYQVNGPLALIQVAIGTECRTLHWTLGEPCSGRCDKVCRYWDFEKKKLKEEYMPGS